MSCCSDSNPAAHFPNPNDRRGGRPEPFNGTALRRQGMKRHPRFFSERVQRASDIVQQPSSITLRELAMAAVVLYALYQAYFTSDRMYTILGRRNVGQVCAGATAMQCLRLHLWQLFWLAAEWAGSVVKWLLVGVVAAFIGEEIFVKARFMLGGKTEGSTRQ